MTYLLQPALLGCVDDVAALSYLLESNQSLFYSEVNPIYNVEDILVYSQVSRAFDSIIVKSKKTLQSS